MHTRITIPLSLIQYGTLYSESQNPEGPQIWKVFLAELHGTVNFARHVYKD
jgi:hypothetical protein